MSIVVDRFNNQLQYGNRMKERVVAWTSSQKSLSARVKMRKINMKKRLTLIVAAVALALLASGGSAKATLNLVVNGGFDNTGNTFVPNGQGYMMVNNGDSTTIPGWTVGNQNIAWESQVTTLSGTILGTPTAYWLDLSGTADGIPYGGVVGTAISTVSGAWYTLSFEVGKGLGQSQHPVVMSATAGNQTATFTDTQIDPGGLNTVWQTFSLQFQATASSTLIALQAPDANSGNGFVGLANVTVVPEPTTMIAGALLLLPFGASSLRVLRRRTA
jgi:hypothetical protein